MNIRIGEKVKTKLTLSIESEIVERAKNLGLNISQFCENALKIGITALENANKQIAQNQTVSDKTGEVQKPREVSDVDRAGFEPATSRVQVGRSYQLNYRPKGKEFISLGKGFRF